MTELINRSDNVIRLVSGSQGSLVSPASRKVRRMKAKQQTENESEVATGLVGRILDGDRSAETELVQRYWDRLRYVLLRKMPLQRDEVEDVLQSTLPWC